MQGNKLFSSSVRKPMRQGPVRKQKASYPFRANHVGLGARPYLVKNDLAGRKFGRLTAEKVAGFTDQGASWICRCKCGNKVVIPRNQLLAGNKKTCGCMTGELIAKAKRDERNPMWRGDKVGYGALHRWVKGRLPKPLRCQICKKKSPLDLSNKGTYDRNLKNWAWHCRRCHLVYDGRMEKLLKRVSTIKPRPCGHCRKTFKPSYGSKQGCSRECSNKIAARKMARTRYAKTL